MKGQPIMDQIRFQQACRKIMDNPRARNGIGTLSEKTLHAVLKEYFEPFEDSHEVRIGGYVADIVGENGIIEIQTANLGKLRKKLETFLKVCDVTVVYPMIGLKYLRWLDEETGELTDRRKSPKKPNAFNGIAELYKIKYLLNEPKLHICLCILEADEIRYLNGWSENKKKGSSRCDYVPVNILDEIYLHSSEDYAELIPKDLPDEFSSAQFAKACKISRTAAQTALNVMTFTRSVERCGKEGNAIIYRVSDILKP